MLLQIDELDPDIQIRQMVKCRPVGMRACSLGLVWLGFRVRDKVIGLVLGIGLMLGLVMVVRLADFTLSH